jgi:aldose 1-epimerase
MQVGTWNGRAVQAVTLRSPAGTEAEIWTWGAVIRDLRVPVAGGLRSVVLALGRFEDYPARSPYLGALVGRYANRIAGGRFTLDGVDHDLDRNEKGMTTLHGGRAGFSQVVWDIADRDAASVTLRLTSPDGDMGFPGRVEATCRYALTDTGGLTVALTATTDRATPVNLSQHSYFNLSGAPTCADHMLTVHADAYTPVDDAAIPTGDIVPVAGTHLDFRTARRLGDDHPLIDHNFVLRGPAGTLRPVAEVTGGGLRMTVTTTKPGLQVYDGSFLDPTLPGAGGRPVMPRAGLCLETQFFPDSPNQPGFPECILRPGQTYRHETRFDFQAV